MWFFKRYTVAEHERALFMQDRRLSKILQPGVYWVFNGLGRVAVEIYDLSNPEFTHPQAELMAKSSVTGVAEHLQRVETGEQEIALVYFDNLFVEVLAPATRKVYWKGPVTVRIERQSIATGFALPKALASALVRPRGGLVLRSVANVIYSTEVADQTTGLLIVDGELVTTLKPGFYAYWKFNRSVVIEQVDTRVQPMEVSGQDILTRDKVTLRVNLVAQYRVTDAVQARNELKSPVDWLYRELQFALRQAVGSRTLDALLGNKDQLDRAIFEPVVNAAAGYGLTLTSVGVKDLILPGEMKTILNQVVEAEKAAQANVIKRREETAATRSLLNTAKLMQGNPTLLRLKELETLEKVTEKVGQMTVFGGLEGILKDTVRINV